MGTITKNRFNVIGCGSGKAGLVDPHSSLFVQPVYDQTLVVQNDSTETVTVVPLPESGASPIVISPTGSDSLDFKPKHLRDFGYDPDEFSISRAVRMSMSIPVFFEAVRLQDASGRVHFIVDGNALSNYPIWLLDDDNSDPPSPTFGFKLPEPDKRGLKKCSRNPINNP